MGSGVRQGRRVHFGVHEEQPTKTGQRQTDHRKAHNRTAPEGDLEGLVESLAGGRRGADIGLGRGLHAEVARQTRTDRTENERQCNQAVGVLFRTHHRIRDAEKDGHRDHEDREHPVFGRQECHGAVGDPLADGLHAFVARILFFDPRRAHVGVDQGDNRHRRCQIYEMYGFHVLLLLLGQC